MSVLEDQGDNQTDSIVEIDLTVENTEYPFVGVTEGGPCRVELANILPRQDARYAEIFNVLGGSPDQIKRYTDSYETVETTCLTEYDDGSLVELLVSDDCPAYRLAELGALPRTVEGVDGRGRIVAEIPSRYDSPEITGRFLEEHPSFELTAKRTKESHTSMLTPSTLQQPILNNLTERQREVLQTAFEMGYYQWPRDCTGQDVADKLEISSATFSEHIFAAEHKIFAFLFKRSSKNPSAQM